MIAPRLKDQNLEREITDMGYVVIPGFLSGGEVDTLLALHRVHYTEPGQRCWNSHIDLSIEAGLEISNQIRALFEPGLERIFSDWRFPYAQFISKIPGLEHRCLLHRDDSIFDETEVEYRQLWLPLVDLMQENGALFMVPKSHRLFTDSKPMNTIWPYEHLIPSLEEEYHVLHIKAGDLVIWIEKTLHGSYENNGMDTRPVIQGGVIHKDTLPLLKRYVKERDEVEVYQVDSEFFIHKEYRNPVVDQKYPFLRTEKHQVRQITDADVKKFYQTHRQTYR